MSNAETLIITILLVIAYFLYQIARQLSYLTGRKLTFRFPKWHPHTPAIPKKKKEEEKENLPN